MTKYPSIKNVWKRDPEDKYRTLIEGVYSDPVFEVLEDCVWESTEKVDGTNIRVMFTDSGTLDIRGRTDKAQLHKDLFGNIFEQFARIHFDLLRTFNDRHDVCLYGEGYGAGIQKGGGNYRSDKGFVLFDIKVGDMYLERAHVENIALQHNIDMVPLIHVGTLRGAISFIRQGLRSTWGNFPMEGVVARPKVELRTNKNERIITKIKTKDFKV